MTAPGTLMAGRYRLVERVAAGGMGWVWEAWDELLHRRVAVKQLLPQVGVTAENAELARHRLIREARITARLHHPHVVTLYDVVDHEGGPCLIMQFVRSRSLSSLLQERGVLPEAAVLRFGAEIAAGLAAAHEVGIVHRDLKPGNVLIAEDGSAKLTDFGISHAAGDASLTATGMITGTPAFLAPEVARGGMSGFPSDVFSFGATLYAALEGTPPFGTDQNPMATLHRVASGRMIPPSRSGGLTPVLLQMLATEPESRPTMSDVAHTLAARHAEMSAAPDPLQGPTVALPPRTIREWPAEMAAANPGPWQGLTQPTPPEPSVPPDPPPTAPALLTSEAGRPRVQPVPSRRWVQLVLAAGIAVLVAATVAILALPRGGTGARGPGSETPTQVALSATTTLPSSASEPAGGLTTSSAEFAPTSAEQPVGQANSVSASPAPTTTGAPSAGPPPAGIASAAPPTSAAALPPPPPAAALPPSASVPSTGAPTAAELAGFITDYYEMMPGGTQAGWERLTSAFQNGTARNRASYQRFWGSIERVRVADVSAVPPGRVEATVTYYFKDGRVAIERTAYSVVRDGSALKINSSNVLSSQSS